VLGSMSNNARVIIQCIITLGLVLAMCSLLEVAFDSRALPLLGSAREEVVEVGLAVVVCCCLPASSWACAASKPRSAMRLLMKVSGSGPSTSIAETTILVLIGPRPDSLKTWSSVSHSSARDMAPSGP
jgi:hypothetical protein